MLKYRKITCELLFSLFFVLFAGTACSYFLGQREPLSFSSPLIINHTCTEFTQIPDQMIAAAKNRIRCYYAHTSHGEQLTVGLTKIMENDSQYALSIDRKHLFLSKTAVSIMDNPYVAPEGFWASSKGRARTEEIINRNSSINLCMWCWCGQLGIYTPGQVQEYLDAMAFFEKKYPDVTFVYITGHAQQGGKKGYNRYICNNIIRKWVKSCQDKNRVLFDFADIDTWRFSPQTGKWEQSTYNYWNGKEYIHVPVEHPGFHGNEKAHTTIESCMQKGKAAWWMFARLSGWQPL